MVPNNKLFTGGFDENVLLWTQDTGLLGYLKVQSSSMACHKSWDMLSLLCRSRFLSIEEATQCELKGGDGVVERGLTKEAALTFEAGWGWDGQVFVVEAFQLKRGDTLTTNMSNHRFVTIELGKGQREQTNTKKGSSPHWFEEFNMSVWNLDENVLVQVPAPPSLLPPRARAFAVRSLALSEGGGGRAGVGLGQGREPPDAGGADGAAGGPGVRGGGGHRPRVRPHR